MKYFAVFQNTSRDKHSKPGYNVSFIGSVLQMYMSIEEIMDRVIKAAMNTNTDGLSVLDQCFIELFLSIRTFDKTKKKNSLSLKKFRKALATE